MEALKAALVRGLLQIFALLPLGVSRGAGRALAAIYWWFGGRARQVTSRNLALAYPQMAGPERERLAKRSLSATGELIGEMGHVWLRSWERIVARLEVRGDRLITDALARGRGVLVLAPHLGNWEVVGLHLATLGPTVALYQPLRLTALGSMVTHARQRTGAKLVPTDGTGLRALLRALRAGGIAGVLPDQVPEQGAAGCNVPFMGVPCFTGGLANRLLRNTGALAVIAYAQRVRGGFVLHYRVAQDAVGGEDPYLALAALNREIEDCLARCPEQYQWEYKRFRTRPGTRGSCDKQDNA